MAGSFLSFAANGGLNFPSPQDHETDLSQQQMRGSDLCHVLILKAPAILPPTPPSPSFAEDPGGDLLTGCRDRMLEETGSPSHNKLLGALSSSAVSLEQNTNSRTKQRRPRGSLLLLHSLPLAKSHRCFGLRIVEVQFASR